MMAAANAIEFGFTQLWQVALLAAAVAVAVRLLARDRPHLAHVLWLVVLIKCVTPPVWSSPTGVFTWIQSQLRIEGLHGVPDERPQTPDAQAIASVPEVVVSDTPASAANDPALQVIVASASPVDASSAKFHAPLTPRPVPGSERSTPLAWALVSLWLGGSVMIVGVAAIRCARCWRMLLRSAVPVDDELLRNFHQLADRLGVRIRVRLLVTSSRVGPAVVGLFKPTVVLPSVVVAGRRFEELEPIVAHELIHVRRGDLWVGLLQVVAQAALWFHPLVWVAGRMVSREAERCADEEVVAALSCSPARYARSLLIVLELKRTLVALPAFPGVRPVEITSQRMERIMRLGQGCRRRTPWWCWVVLLLVGALSLPGAPRLRADDEPAVPAPTVVETQVKDPSPSQVDAAEPIDEPAASDAARYAASWTGDAQPLLEMIEAELGQTADEARQTLMKHLFSRLVGDALASDGQAVARQIKLRPGGIVYEGAAEPGGALKRLRIKLADDGTFTARQTPAKIRDMAAVHREIDRIQRALGEMREFGFRGVSLNVWMVAGPTEHIEAVSDQWTTLPTSIPEGDYAGTGRTDLLARALARDRAAAKDHREYLATGWWHPQDDLQHGRASLTVEEVLPVMLEVIDERRRTELIDQFQADRRSSVLRAPRVSMFSGQSCQVLDVAQSPFVVGLRRVVEKDNAVEPQIRVVCEGLHFAARAVLREQNVQLDYQLTMSEIRDVKTRETPLGVVQAPVVARMQVESSIELPLDGTLLLGGLKRLGADGAEQSVLVMVQATKPDRDALRGLDAVENVRTSDALPDDALLAGHALATVNYSVVDLVRAARIADMRAGQTAARPDFETLIELITTTIEPTSWDSVGGEGSIQPFPTNLSIVVCNTPAVHARIEHLLKTLRGAPSAPADAPQATTEQP